MFLLISSTLSCEESLQMEKEVTAKSTISLHAKNTFESQNKSLDERYSLILDSDIKDGIARVQVDYLEKLVSSSSCGNCEFLKNEKGEIKIDTLNFSTDSRGFLVTAFIRGSNYGAEQYFIIYQNPYWNISVLPFDVAQFKDIDGDSFDEIVEYKMDDSTVYSFIAGVLIKK